MMPQLLYARIDQSPHLGAKVARTYVLSRHTLSLTGHSLAGVSG
jgi:hypothetical protein